MFAKSTQACFSSYSSILFKLFIEKLLGRNISNNNSNITERQKKSFPPLPKVVWTTLLGIKDILINTDE